jgi:hypothetical protein
MFWEDKQKKKTDWVEAADREREQKREDDNRYTFLKQKTDNINRRKEIERMERKVKQDEFNRSSTGKIFNMTTGVAKDFYVTRQKKRKGEKKRSIFGRGML